jgi:hypothetical protein
MEKRCETCKWWTPADADEVKDRKAKGLSCFGSCGWWAKGDLPACIINENYWTIYDDEGSDCACWEAKAV